MKAGDCGSRKCRLDEEMAKTGSPPGQLKRSVSLKAASSPRTTTIANARAIFTFGVYIFTACRVTRSRTLYLVFRIFHSASEMKMMVECDLAGSPPAYPATLLHRFHRHHGWLVRG